MAYGKKPQDPAVRYRSQIDVDSNGCWIWRGSTIRGYGVFQIGSRSDGSCRTVYAHRFSWMLHLGAIPDGMFVLHKCDVPKCSNPDHLYLGTHADNMADRNKRGRVPIGSHHGRALLTEKDVLDIRASSETTKERAERYGVSIGAIEDIIYYRNWRHVA